MTRIFGRILAAIGALLGCVVLAAAVAVGPSTADTSSPPASDPASTSTAPASSTIEAPPAKTTTITSTESTSESPPLSTTGTIEVTTRLTGTTDEVPGAGVSVMDAKGGQHEFTTPLTTELPAGQVSVTAVAAPRGYHFVGHTYATGVVNAGSVTAFAFAVAKDLTPPAAQGAVKVVVRDRATGAPLPGTTVQIIRCDGRVPIEAQITGPDGSFTRLFDAPTTFCVMEVGPPAGYELTGTVYQVDLTPGDTVVVTIYNDPIHYTKHRDPQGRIPIRSIPTGRTA
ncbi:hypothetical protein nbrc107696_32270 [Gordonia spumicola]|uniref:SpaA-like prealbumin fold domain-containing protein n=1 Tax=Gordonia spumicola TaxID=589161 RepID=A0A7I9VCC2_9ACTN|nr:SpaA isopeptide-forming pilin-related protein [Gordonia spumicola]GEE02781.1 hypothetical protein nbrc107696_32270 [Gordonia spumicola]